MRGVQIVNTCALVACTVLLCLTFWRVEIVHDTISGAYRYMTDQVHPIGYAEWRSGGVLVKVTTPKEPGQTNAQWASAHRAAVDAMLVEFPKDPA